MGREIRRVPLGFQWPMNETWWGFLSPVRGFDCKVCNGSGENAETRRVGDAFYAHSCPDDMTPWNGAITQDEVEALVAAGRLMDFTHRFKTGTGWVKDPDAPMPTAAEVNSRQRRGFCHDGINRGILIETRAKRLGVYGPCTFCDGKGALYHSDEIREMAKRDLSVEPPKGDAYQLWETVSEGSPISPPFATPEELARWLAEHDDSTTRGTTYSEWLGFICGPGWAPTLVASGGKVEPGVRSDRLA